MTYFPILAAMVLGGWAFLSLLGGERTRLAQDAEARAAAEAKKKADAVEAKSQGLHEDSAPLPMLTPSLTSSKPAAAAAPAKAAPPRKSAEH